MTAHPRLVQHASEIVSPHFPLRVGLLTPHNVLDRTSFSGTAFRAAAALEDCPGLSVRWLGAHHRTPRRIDRVLRKAPIEPGPINFDGLDAIVGLVATRLLDHLNTTSLPYLHVTDATPGFQRDAYGWEVPASADKAEARILRRASLAIYSSDALAQRARTEFSYTNTTVLPFGINLDETPRVCPRKPALTQPNLLFVGMDWTRKGGDIAVAALDRLRAGGLDATLTVVGRVPDEVRGHPGIRCVGFLNKNRRRERNRLAALYRDAHLLVLPTRADCTPMVIGEAMSFGTPVLSSDTGGVADMIGQTAGRVLTMDAGADEWAGAIRSTLSNPDAYAMLSDAAFDRANARFSWAAWAKGIEALVRDIGHVAHVRTA